MWNVFIDLDLCSKYNLNGTKKQEKLQGRSIKNAKKVQDLYQKKGIELYVKQDYVTNPEFITELSQYDILLDSTKTEDEVNSVLSTVLASYEEAVLKK